MRWRFSKSSRTSSTAATSSILAVAVVIGGAFGKIVTALVSDLVMPLVNAVVPQGDWGANGR